MYAEFKKEIGCVLEPSAQLIWPYPAVVLLLKHRDNFVAHDLAVARAAQQAPCRSN
jgi:hypothetical protein